MGVEQESNEGGHPQLGRKNLNRNGSFHICSMVPTDATESKRNPNQAHILLPPNNGLTDLLATWTDWYF